MRTYWKHHVTLAYLAAADARWKQTVTKQLNETMLYFMRYSKGGVIIDQHHWMGRPRACHYYRRVNIYEGSSNKPIRLRLPS